MEDWHEIPNPICSALPFRQTSPRECSSRKRKMSVQLLDANLFYTGLLRLSATKLECSYSKIRLPYCIGVL